MPIMHLFFKILMTLKHKKRPSISSSTLPTVTNFISAKNQKLLQKMQMLPKMWCYNCHKPNLLDSKRQWLIPHFIIIIMKMMNTLNILIPVCLIFLQMKKASASLHANKRALWISQFKHLFATKKIR